MNDLIKEARLGTNHYTEDDCFVLRPVADRVARVALLAYAVYTANAKLGVALISLVKDLEKRDYGGLVEIMKHLVEEAEYIESMGEAEYIKSMSGVCEE